MEGALEIRKLRKKLRQIENLQSINRALTHIETVKVSRRDAIREDLSELLQQYTDLNDSSVLLNLSEISLNTTATTDSSFHSISSQDPKIDMKRSGDRETGNSGDASAGGREGGTAAREDPPKKVQRKSARVAEDVTSVKTENVSDITEDVISRGDDIQTADVEDRSISDHALTTEGSTVDTASTSQVPSTSQNVPETSRSAKPKKAKKRHQPTWRNKNFTVRNLMGHYDMILSVDCDGSTLVSGGRDTMVKHWNTDTGVELHSMGGHTGAITSVRILPPNYTVVDENGEGFDPTERFAVSASSDCSIKLWRLGSGALVRSVYVYCPVTCMECFPSADRPLVAVGTDGGKVEIWDVNDGTVVASKCGDEEGVDTLTVSGDRIVSVSCSGKLRVWQLKRENELSMIYISEDGGLRLNTPRCVREGRNGVYYVGDYGVNIKVFDWNNGSLRKIKNHEKEFGFSDALAVVSDKLMLSSGFDIDNGQGFINLWNVQTDEYLTTVRSEDMTRILALSAAIRGNGECRIVAGGYDLIVIDTTDGTIRKSGNLYPAEYIQTYSTEVVDSSSDSDGCSSEDGSDSISRSRTSRTTRPGQPPPSSWTSWCSIT